MSIFAFSMTHVDRELRALIDEVIRKTNLSESVILANLNEHLPRWADQELPVAKAALKAWIDSGTQPWNLLTLADLLLKEARQHSRPSDPLSSPLLKQDLLKQDQEEDAC